jgi:hypothetical protein
MWGSDWLNGALLGAICSKCDSGMAGVPYRIRKSRLFIGHHYIRRHLCGCATWNGDGALARVAPIVPVRSLLLLCGPA